MAHPIHGAETGRHALQRPHPRHRRHRQDRPPRRRAPDRARRARPDRLAHGAAGVRLGGPRDLAGRDRRGRRAAYVAFAPDLALPGRAAAVIAVARARHARACGASCCSRAGARRRRCARRPRRAPSPRLDGPALQLLHAELHRGRVRARRTAGELALPVGDVGEPFIDADDIADVAVAALLEDGHDRRALRADRPAAADVRRGGRQHRARAERADGRVHRRARVRRTREAEIALLEYLFGKVLDGRNAWVTDGVQQVLGRAPREVMETAR